MQLPTNQPTNKYNQTKKKHKKTINIQIESDIYKKTYNLIIHTLFIMITHNK